MHAETISTAMRPMLLQLCTSFRAREHTEVGHLMFDFEGNNYSRTDISCIIIMGELTNEKIDSLIELCTSMLNQSYCPYSKFAVGAVLVTDCGKIFTGKLTLTYALDQ